MIKRWMVALSALALAACGSVSDLKPAAGQSLPQKPALVARALTPDELLTPPPYARPARVDELNKKGDPRKPDRFDLPPPDGAAAAPGTSVPQNSASTTGPENSDEPKR